jgi:DNA (cytosine-5)-methyltransferase 1
MQLLNTRWFLPQNRERLFFVGHLRGSGSRQIFPIGEAISIDATKGEYSKEGVACTFGTRSAKSRLGSDYTIIKVKSGVKLGYEIAEIGDSINTSFIESKTRKWRVGKGIAQTFQTSSTQCVVISLDKFRDLTPLEYERGQGLPDNWTQYGNYDGKVKEISDTQRYRLCGNGVSIPVVQAIAERLKY